MADKNNSQPLYPPMTKPFVEKDKFPSPQELRTYYKQYPKIVAQWLIHTQTMSAIYERELANLEQNFQFAQQKVSKIDVKPDRTWLVLQKKLGEEFKEYWLQLRQLAAQRKQLADEAAIEGYDENQAEMEIILEAFSSNNDKLDSIKHSFPQLQDYVNQFIQFSEELLQQS